MNVRLTSLDQLCVRAIQAHLLKAATHFDRTLPNIDAVRLALREVTAKLEDPPAGLALHTAEIEPDWASVPQSN